MIMHHRKKVSMLILLLFCSECKYFLHSFNSTAGINIYPFSTNVTFLRSHVHLLVNRVPLMDVGVVCYVAITIAVIATGLEVATWAVGIYG